MKDNELDERDGLATDQKSDIIRDAEPVETSDQAVSLQAESTGTMSYSPAQAGDPAETATAGGIVASGFGQILRDARIRRGMNIGKVAHRLRLSEQQVEAIEAQDFSRLPAAVFLRGYIRNYANLLQLDDVPLLMEAVPQARPVDTVFASKRNAQRFKAIEPAYRSGRSSRGGWLYIAVILAALAAYGIYRDEVPEQLVSFSAEDTDQVMSSISADGNDQVAIDLALPLSSSSGLPLVTPAPTGAGLPSVATTLPELPVLSVPVAEVPKASDDGKKSLHFSFSRDSWVKIKDGGGRVILEKTHLRGTEQTIEGKPPLYLVIGNAAGVSLTYNGRKVDLAPYTRGNDDVARFSLE